MADLRADCLGKCVGHGTVIEGAEDATAAVHGQIARGPNRGSPDIAGKDGVVGGKLVEDSGDVLGMDRLLARFAGGKFVEAFAGFSVMFEGGLGVLVSFVLD